MNKSKRQGWIKLIAGLLLLGAAGLGVLHFIQGRQASATEDEGPGDDAEAAEVLVKVVQPKKDPHFALRVERPANVEAYYRAPIKSRVAGEVEWIVVDKGAEVKKGEPLVKVFVPDLDADAVQKCRLVDQRKQEWALAKSAVKTAAANVAEKATLLDTAKEITKLRVLQLKRIQGLFDRRAIDEESLDEAKENLGVARASEKAATAAKEKADAEEDDSKIKVVVKDAEVKVAESACEAAQALAGYARVKAPWTGTVVDRHVDPGSFVQNASTGHPTPLVTMERTDIVTVAMRVPDNVAPFVTEGTEAILKLDELPGVKIKGKVTRIAKTLETKDRDRTMRVEVDLWNSDPSLYQAFLNANYVWNEKKHRYEPRHRSVEVYNELKAGKYTGKEAPDFLKLGPPPLVPEFEGKERDLLKRPRHLWADMFGRMTLILVSFADSYLVPSVAVFHEGGRELMYVVEEKVDKGGKLEKVAHKVPVRVQVDDGNMAKLVLVDNDDQVKGDLTGKEEVIVSNQEELSEGQAVKPALQEDWHALKRKH
jgi:multidrug resistance efflux pump